MASVTSVTPVVSAARPANGAAQPSQPTITQSTPQPNRKPSYADLEKRIAELEAAKAARANQPIKLQVSEKKALSVYGLGRFPTTLYAAQWRKLLNPVVTKAILDYIDENESAFAWKE